MITHKKIEIETPAAHSFYDVTESVEAEVALARAHSGIVVVSTPHTTCSVLIQEESHDRDYLGVEFLMRDLMEALELVAPTCRSEGQYRHPGVRHIAAATTERDEQPWWSLNVDAHLRSVLLGRSETVPVVDGALHLGEFGRVYFADLDQVRARARTVLITIMTDG